MCRLGNLYHAVKKLVLEECHSVSLTQQEKDRY